MTTIDPIKETDRIVSFLKTSCARAGFMNAVIGLSGGVDSATSCALCVHALGKDHVYPVLLPYGMLTMQGTIDAMSVIECLNISLTNVFRVDITKPTDTLMSLLASTDQTRKGNIMARMRMITLFDQAKRRGALVVGTENKSENLLGYFTRYGDQASDIEPIAHLYKTQVYEVAKHIGLPEQILTKPPTAALFPGQTDEGDFGFTYQEGDQILSLLYDEKKSIEDIVASGFNKEVVERVKARVDGNAFKHDLPIKL